MAKKKVQTVEKDVEVIAPDVETKQSNKKVNTKDAKKDTKVENTKQKTKKPNKEKKSVKKKAAEVMSELKKVSKPSFGKVAKNTCVVIAVVAICTLLLFGIDRLFGWVNELLIP